MLQAALKAVRQTAADVSLPCPARSRDTVVTRSADPYNLGMITRRSFLTAAASVVAAAARARTPEAERLRTRLILLGTAGGPAPKVARAAPAQAVVVGDRIYLVDCGDGVARQLALALSRSGRTRTRLDGDRVSL